MWVELFVLVVLLFVCIVGSAFLGWVSKEVSWWLVGAIAALISTSAVFVWLLWLYDWKFQRIQEEWFSFSEMFFLVTLVLLCATIPVLLSVLIGSRTKEARRVGLYSLAIFSIMFLVESVIIIVRITWEFNHWQF